MQWFVVSSVHVCLFPASGFSRQMVAILQEFNCTFNTFNILADEEVRLVGVGRGGTYREEG